jgi:hypothetical protein
VVVPPQLAAAVELAVESQGEEDTGQAGEQPKDEVELRSEIRVRQAIVDG